MKALFCFVLAALLTGRAVHAPTLKKPLPDSCDARNYLLAYAYARENPALARKFLAASQPCTPELIERIRVLKASLP